MTHVLFRPHVAGAEGQITTPDVIIDRVAIECDGRSHYAPVQRVTTRVDLQALPGDLTVVPACALIAAGGGVLVGLATLVHGRDDRPATADVLLARSAWRLRSLAPHVRSIEIRFDTGDSSRGVPISELAQPADVLSRADGELVLPKGVAIVCCFHGARPHVACTGQVHAPASGREARASPRALGGASLRRRRTVAGATVAPIRRRSDGRREALHLNNRGYPRFLTDSRCTPAGCMHKTLT